MSEVVKQLEQALTKVGRVHGDTFDPKVREPLAAAMTNINEAIAAFEAKEREVMQQAFGQPRGDLRRGHTKASNHVGFVTGCPDCETSKTWG